MACYTKFPSPIGEILLTSDGEALTGLWLDTQTPRTVLGGRQDDLPLFCAVRDWLEGYFLGNPPAIAFPMAPAGTPFQQTVWQHLRAIPWSETTTYGAIAKAISQTMSAQAVGQAVGRNPISIIVPCHRCVGVGNRLTGYDGGLKKKQWLLNHEGGTL